MDRGTTLLACRIDAPTALDTAYDMYAVGLYDYCRWALGDDKLASDAVADTLLAAVGRGLIPTDAAPPRPEPRLKSAPRTRTTRSAPRAADGEPLRAWIFAVARAECAARAAALAGSTAHASTPVPIPGGAVVDGGGSRFRDRNFPIPQLTLDEQWQLAQLRKALDELSPAAQEVAELAFRHGFSAPALAAILCRPLRAVRAAVAEAYAHLSGSCADGVAVAFAVSPFAPLPPALRRLVLEAAAVPSRPRHLAERHAPYARDGFPGSGRRRVAGRLALAAAAVAALAVAVAVLPSLTPQPATTTAAASENAPGAELDLPHPDAAAAAPEYATAPTPAAPKPSAVSKRPLAGKPRRHAPPAAPAPVLRRGMSTRMEFAYNLATKAWDVRITATVHGFSPAEVRIAVWWHDSAGTHRRRPTATRIGADAYAAEVRGLTGDPQACAQAVAVSASGETLMGPVTGPAGYPYCG